MNELAPLLACATKVYALGRIARGVRSHRPCPQIPTQALFLSLLLGVFLRAGSYLDISKQTKRRRWQHLIHWGQRISDDALHYVADQRSQVQHAAGPGTDSSRGRGSRGGAAPAGTDAPGLGRALF